MTIDLFQKQIRNQTNFIGKNFRTDRNQTCDCTVQIHHCGAEARKSFVNESHNALLIVTLGWYSRCLVIENTGHTFAQPRFGYWRFTTTGRGWSLRTCDLCERASAIAASRTDVIDRIEFDDHNGVCYIEIESHKTSSTTVRAYPHWLGNLI